MASLARAGGVGTQDYCFTGFFLSLGRSRIVVLAVLVVQVFDGAVDVLFGHKSLLLLGVLVGSLLGSSLLWSSSLPGSSSLLG